MSIQVLDKLDGSIAKRARSFALLLAAVTMASCDGANQGVQLGNGQSPDPVIVDFPIAYIKAPLVFDEDDGMLQQTDLRELINLNGPVSAALDDWLTWMRPMLRFRGWSRSRNC